MVAFVQTIGIWQSIWLERSIVCRLESLKCDSQSQPNCAAAVNSFLREGLRCFSEFRVWRNLEARGVARINFKLRLKRIGIYLDVKSTKIRKAAVCEIQVRHPYRVIENIVEVSAESRCHSLSNFEILVQPEIDAPSSRSPQEILSGDCRIIENIGAHGRRRKCVGVEELIACVLLVIADHQRPEPDEIVKVPKGIDRVHGNISWTDGAR